jgi:hypothetical protein
LTVGISQLEFRFSLAVGPLDCLLRFESDPIHRILGGNGLILCLDRSLDRSTETLRIKNGRNLKIQDFDVVEVPEIIR